MSQVGVVCRSVRLLVAALALSAFGAGCSGNPAGSGADDEAVGSESEAVTLSTSIVVTGGVHACAIVQGGAVKCWGYNGDGELGVGDTNNRGVASSQMGDSLPSVYLGAGRTAKGLALGFSHTCALLDNGPVKCWGLNGSGQLGQNNATSIGGAPNDMQNLQPVNLGTGRTAKLVAAGNNQTCAILDNNQLKCWGYNNYGQLGLAVGNMPASGGKLTVGTAAGDMASLPAINLGTGRTAKAVTLGQGHTCAILDTNQIKCWGDNESGNLGLGVNGGGNVHATDVGDNPNELGDALATVNLGTGRSAKAVAAGTSDTCALLDNSQIKCWGSDNAGSLGANLMAGINIGGHPTDMGDNLRQVVLPAGRSALAVTAGGDSACALLDTQQIECWGANSSGHLGTGDSTERGTSQFPMDGKLVALGTNLSALSVSMGQNSACAAASLGWVKCWGGNTWGQLGDGDTVTRGSGASDMGNNLPFVNLGSLTGWQVAVGLDSVCVALFGDQGTGQSTVKCWGDNSSGTLGYGDTVTRGSRPGQMGAALPDVDFGTDDNGLPLTINAVYSGGFHSCVVVTSFPSIVAQALCWGSNNSGQLGLGDTSNRGDAPAEMGNNLPFVDVGTSREVGTVVEGAFSTCALLDNNQVKCWGYNGSGQLGLGDINNRGDNPGEMGDNLPFVSLGTGRSVKANAASPSVAIAAGGDHVCVILDNSTVKCWGDNTFGQLGLGNTAARGDNPNEMGNNLPAVNLGTGRTAKAITAGSAHTCAILDNSTVKCWGYNGFGQLGLGDINSRGDNANEMGNSLPTVNLGTGRTAKAIAAGAYHTCALLDNNQVKCWGDNLSAQLGLGDTNSRGDNANEMGNSLPALNFGLGRTPIALVAGRGDHTCVVLDDQQVKCWGYNGTGQLGQGDINNRGDNAGEMGDALRVVDTGPDRPAASTVAAIAGGSDHACAVMADATASCWGDNAVGDLGQGNFNPKLPPAPVLDATLSPLHGVKAIASAASTSCAVLTDGTVDCWGVNVPGVGTSDVAVPVAGVSGAIAISSGGGQTCALLASGDASCWMGQQSPALVGLQGGTAITVGGSWACALISDGTVQCWGREDFGEFGDRGSNVIQTPSAATAVPNLSDAVAVSGAESGYHVCAVRADGGVLCWGENRAGEIGDGTTPMDQVDGPTPVSNLTGAFGVVAGMIQHSCAVLTNGTVECWGDNSEGQLGDGTMAPLLSPSTTAAVSGITNAASVTAGDNFSCAALSDGRAFCWGFGSDANLGNGAGLLSSDTPVGVQF